MSKNDNGRSLIVLVLFILLFGITLFVGRYSNASTGGNFEPNVDTNTVQLPSEQISTGIPGPDSEMMPIPPMTRPSSIAVSGGYVYVVQGNKLVKFNAATLKHVASADIN